MTTETTARAANEEACAVAVQACKVQEECGEAARAAAEKDWTRAAVFASRAKRGLVNLIKVINEIRDRKDTQ